MTLRQGRCHCGTARFEMQRDPIIVHACHCRDCQVQSGGVFVVNAVVEAQAVTLTAGRIQSQAMATQSGGRHVIHRCPACHTALWSEYSTPGVYFVRALTLVDGEPLMPDVHIFTRSRHPAVCLPDEARIFEGFYDPREVWTDAMKARVKAARDAVAD